MICYLFPKPLYFIFSSDVPALLYYSYIPTTVVALLIGFYVLWNNKYSLLNQLLFAISVLFSFWSMSALIEWTNIHSNLILFFWNFQGMIFSLIAISSIYFIYVFLDKKDISIRIKIAFLALLAPIFILTPTFYLKGFNITNCDAFEFSWRPFEIYYTSLGVLAMIWILVILIRKYRTAEADFKKQIFLMGVGIELFLFSFFTIIFLAAYLTDMGIVSDSRLEFYGLFGMDIFVVFLAYLIVKFKAFKIKLIASQALVVGLAIIIGSEFFFAENPTNKILIAFTLAISIILGYQLVKSVKREVERKEQLEALSRQLSVANDKLHELDKAKSEFISIASHQLRTPLTAIKGFVSLLLEGTYGPVAETQRPALEKTYISNERLVQLVEDLLNVSRIEAGRMEFDFQLFQAEDIIQEVVDTLALSAKNKGLYLNYQKPGTPLQKIKMDGGKIREVISNMVDNAIKYTPKGGVTVRIEKRVSWDTLHKAHNDVVRIVVSDTGIGVDPKEIKSIFEKFQRGKGISHYHTDGTGLGMYVGQKIVEVHKGKIWAESEGVGKGSRFILELPFN